ncbi:hypothetical protein LZ31DRAFT_90039 [Colletotrichum somersetense]|nr:hypothetical protein LZ31DRAFT_90039 [Colletotrichum somersetense]
METRRRRKIERILLRLRNAHVFAVMPLVWYFGTFSIMKVMTGSMMLVEGIRKDGKGNLGKEFENSCRQADGSHLLSNPCPCAVSLLNEERRVVFFQISTTQGNTRSVGRPSRSSERNDRDRQVCSVCRHNDLAGANATQGRRCNRSPQTARSGPSWRARKRSTPRFY